MAMRTFWHVEKMTATETTITAELVRREWFKKNPEWVALNDEYDALAKARGEAAASNAFVDREYPEEFIDAEPGGEGADFLDTRRHDEVRAAGGRRGEAVGRRRRDHGADRGGRRLSDA